MNLNDRNFRAPENPYLFCPIHRKFSLCSITSPRKPYDDATPKQSSWCLCWRLRTSIPLVSPSRDRNTCLNVAKQIILQTDKQTMHTTDTINGWMTDGQIWGTRQIDGKIKIGNTIEPKVSHWWQTLQTYNMQRTAHLSLFLYTSNLETEQENSVTDYRRYQRWRLRIKHLIIIPYSR